MLASLAFDDSLRNTQVRSTHHVIEESPLSHRPREGSKSDANEDTLEKIHREKKNQEKRRNVKNKLNLIVQWFHKKWKLYEKLYTKKIKGRNVENLEQRYLKHLKKKKKTSLAKSI